MLFAQQSQPAGVAYGERGGGGSSDAILGIVNMLAQSMGQRDEREYRRALTGLANEQATDTRDQRTARQRMGQMIASQFRVDPTAVKQQVMIDSGNMGAPQNVTPDPAAAAAAPSTYATLPDAELAARRTLASRQITPDFVGQVLGQRVQAGSAADAGGDIGDILANAAVASRDADSAAGFRGTPLAPGASVFQSDAHDVNRFNEEQDTARNNADNATTQRGQDIQSRTSLGVANINAAVDREQIQATNNATNAQVAAARAARLDQQTINAALNQALGIRDNRSPPGPANYRANLMARTTQLLRENENLDPVTAAALAVQELLVEEPASEGILGVGRHGRRYDYTDFGETYRPPAATPSPAPAATAPAPANSFPPGAMVDDETGEVFDANGRLIGNIRRGR